MKKIPRDVTIFISVFDHSIGRYYYVVWMFLDEREEKRKERKEKKKKKHRKKKWSLSCITNDDRFDFKWKQKTK